jgi:hypothetical protein
MTGETMVEAIAIPAHLKWLHNTNERLKTIDGKVVLVWELCYEIDEEVISTWAKHLRIHYCFDEEIDQLRDGTGLSRAEYLERYIFPDGADGFGPGIRAGDFGEILVADFLEYIRNYWVPRTRYNKKEIPNESTKGCDVIGFKVLHSGVESPEDVLATFEVKTQFSGNKAKTRLQDAVDDSGKDPTRVGDSLNAIKRRLLSLQKTDEAKRVSRFQNLADHPYREVNGAAALFSSEVYDPNLIQSTDCHNHVNSSNLALLIIRGDGFMNLVHELYRRAANEA